MQYYIGTIPISPYMQHFGIQGMKWGVRKYQNPDGSLTEAGKARYYKGIEKDAKKIFNARQKDKRTLGLNHYEDRVAKKLDLKNKKKDPEYKERLKQNLSTLEKGRKAVEEKYVKDTYKYGAIGQKIGTGIAAATIINAQVLNKIRISDI